jgi:hypothetical protein
MEYLSILPDALQQIAIASTLLYFAYRMGRRRLLISKNKPTPMQDEFYQQLVKWLLIATTIISAEAVFQSTVAMAEEVLPADVVPSDGKTTQWLKQHSDLFWVVLALRQTMVMGILGYELMSETKVKQLVWFGVLAPILQWHVGLFAKDPMAGAVVGLLFETMTPLLLMIYLVKICMSDLRLRAIYGFFASLFYMISALPVLLLALQMRGPHEVLYLTVFFGILSFFCWSRAVIKTPQKSKSVNIERDFTRIPEEDKEDHVSLVIPKSPAFTIDDKENN